MVESIIQNHGFADGNKRTAMYLVSILTERSGFELMADDETIVRKLVAVAEGKLGYSHLVEWFRECLEPIDEA